MTDLVKTTLLAMYAIWIRATRRFSGQRRVLLCCSPTPEKNRGDQALNNAVVQALHRRGHDRLILVATGTGELTSFNRDPRYELHDELSIVFTTNRCFKEQIQWLRLMRHANDVLIHGADVLDESYGVARSAGTFKAARLAAWAGVPVRILGFSISASPSKTLTDRVASLPKLVTLLARDAISQKRFHDAGVKRIKLVADSAFMLEPADATEFSGDIQRAFGQNHDGVVGINLTEILVPTENDLETNERLMFLARTWVRVTEKTNCHLLLISHTEGGLTWSSRLHEAITKVLDDSDSTLDRNAVTLINPVPRAEVLKAIAGQCRHVFSCRMHLAIATLGMGVPVTCFPYRGKFEGLYQHFDLEEGILPPDTLPDDVEMLAGILADRIEMSEAIAEHIEARLPNVKELSARNLDGIAHPPNNIQTDLSVSQA